MSNIRRRLTCIIRGHVYCPQVGDGWIDVFCQRCGERTLMFNRTGEFVGNDLMPASGYLWMLLASVSLAVGGIVAQDVPYALAGGIVAIVSTIIRIIAIRDEARKMENDWEFCDITPGCVREKGHGGECKMAKGL
jgi:hypothetical protein